MLEDTNGKALILIPGTGVGRDMAVSFMGLPLVHQKHRSGQMDAMGVTCKIWVPGSYPASSCSIRIACGAWSRIGDRSPTLILMGLSQTVSTKVPQVHLLLCNRSLPVS